MEFDPFRFLSWRARLVPLVGRDDELNSLLRWAEGNSGVKVRFLTGPGGTGKSRLAAELAFRLREKNWSAGFAALDKPAVLPVPKQGLLWIADYPEENRQDTQALLSSLARIEKPPTAVRLLLLSRRELDWWQADVDAAHAADICDTQSTKITSLSETDTAELYHLAYERVVEHLSLARAKIDEAAVRLWWKEMPTLHGLPLFTMAAAIHSAVERTSSPTLSGGKIVQALVRRERLRMDNIGCDVGFGKFGLSRLIALAAISGELRADDVRHLANSKFEIGLPLPEVMFDLFYSVPWWKCGSLPALAPDILAAVLLLEVLSDRPDRAPAWLWAAIERSSSQWVSRIERLAFDMKRVYGSEENRISKWLVEMTEVPGVRMEALEPVLLVPSPRAVLQLAVRVGKALAADRQISDVGRAARLQNASNVLSYAGDTEGALELIEEAVKINRTLAASGELEDRSRLAGSLNNLSNRLNEAKKRNEAVTASSEALDLLRKLTLDDPTSDGIAEQLANALNNHSAHLEEVGQRNEAIEAITVAVELYRQLAKSQRLSIEAALANALNNLAQALPETKYTEAMKAVEEAIEIYERLAADNPTRFEPGLASSLNTVSSLRSKAGDRAGSLAAAQRCLTIRNRLAIESPQHFEPELAVSYETISLRLAEQGEASTALEMIREAVRVWRRLAEAEKERFLPDLARSLDHESVQLQEQNKEGEALASNEEAVNIWRWLAKLYPQRFEPDLARSLCNLSQRKSRTSDAEGGLAMAREAVELFRPLAAKEPDNFSFELALSLMALCNRILEAAYNYRFDEPHDATSETGSSGGVADRKPALIGSASTRGLYTVSRDVENGHPFAMISAIMAITESVEILRELARKDPQRFEEDLARALFRFSLLLGVMGDNRQDAVLEEISEILLRVLPERTHDL